MSDWYFQLQDRVDSDRDWDAPRYIAKCTLSFMDATLSQLLAEAKAKLEKEPILDDPAHFSLPPYDWRG